MKSVVRSVALLALAAVASCSSPDVTEVEDWFVVISVESGDDQAGPAGSVLSQQLVVRVTNRKGELVPGVFVDFMVTAGGGSVEGSATGMTGDDGRARTRWKLGPTAGAAQAFEVRLPVTANADNRIVAFSATAQAGPSSRVVTVP